MQEPNPSSPVYPLLPEEDQPQAAPPARPKYWLHALLFVITLGTTTLAGLEWLSPEYAKALYGGTLSWQQFSQGFWFSVPFLGILTVHEFGHYGLARYHKVRVTLPYYIPLWLGWAGSLSIGTMGAFIRIQEQVRSRRHLFDIAAAGPLAGYAACLLVLAYGYTHLPPPEYIFQIHPEYIPYGLDYAKVVYSSGKYELIGLGGNLTTDWLSDLAINRAWIPNPYELMHYPVLFAGYVALFFTALNLFPIGQLDGGHILYGLVGPVWHRRLSPFFFLGLVIYSGIGVAQPMNYTADPAMMDKLTWNLGYLVFLYITFSRTLPGFLNQLMLAVTVFGIHYTLAVYAPEVQGYNGWLVFCLILGRFLGIYHPPALHDEELTPAQKWVGLLSLVVFALCFSPRPFMVD